MHNIAEREEILLSIKKDLVIMMGNSIVSAVVYGSSLSDDYCFLSDIDILVVLDVADSASLEILREIKRKYEKDGFDLDFNVHTVDELPDKRKKTFWHNNRALYMQIELCLYGKQLVGPNLFSGKDVNVDDLRLEVVRVVSSLTYQARKMLINSNLSTRKRITMMKWCIYGVMYYLAFWEMYPKTRKEAMQRFHQISAIKTDPNIFLEHKSEHPENIKISDLNIAYDFLSELESLALKEYIKIYGANK